MSALVVPTFSDPSWSQTTTFEGIPYILQFDFNQRASCWYLSVADATGVDIYNGIKIVCGQFLLRKCKDVRRPLGDLLCLSSTADETPPSIADLLPGSGRCTLAYMTSDWLDTIRAGGAASLLATLTAGTQGSPTSTYGQS